MRGPRAGRIACALAAAYLGIAACELLVGIEDREEARDCPFDPPPGGAVRAGHLAPATEPVAFCLSVPGAEPVRVPRGLPGCPAALRYRELAAPAALAHGVYDVRVVAAGAACDAAPMVEARALRLGDGAGTTLLLLGGGAEPLRVAAFAESAPPASGMAVRFIHAAPGAGPLDVGTAKGAGLPAELTDTIFRAVRFGESSAGRSLKPQAADAAGYQKVVSFDWFVGAAPADTKAAVLATKISAVEHGGHALTVYAVGDGRDETPVAPLVCDEQEVAEGRTRCASGPVAHVVLDTLALSLGALLVPHDQARASAMGGVLAASDADVVCLQEAWPRATRDGLAAAAAGRLAYRFAYDFTHDTPFTDARDLSGRVPAPPSAPPCSGGEELGAMNALVDCLRDNCSTAPGSDDGTLSELACGTSACLDLATALTRSDPDGRCGVCVLIMVGTRASFAEVRADCTTVAAPFAFGGESGLLLLSRLRAVEEEAVVMPATWVRRDAIRVRLRLDNGVPLDVYCAYMAPVPPWESYSGVYGSGATGMEAWRNEQRLFVRQLVALAEDRSGVGKAVVMGSFYVGPVVRDAAGNVVIDGAEPDRYAELVAGLPAFAPPGFAPRCTLCSDNPLSAQPRSTWIDHVLGRRLALDEPLALEPRFGEAVVPVEGGAVPLSVHYGWRARLGVRP
jgi:hypothetical protein